MALVRGNYVNIENDHVLQPTPSFPVTFNIGPLQSPPGSAEPMDGYFHPKAIGLPFGERLKLFTTLKKKTDVFSFVGIPSSSFFNRDFSIYA